MKYPLSNDIFFINIFHFIAYLHVSKYMCIFYQQHFIYSKIFFILWNKFICYSSILCKIIWCDDTYPDVRLRHLRHVVVVVLVPLLCAGITTVGSIWPKTQQSYQGMRHWSMVIMYANAYFQGLQIILLVLYNSD